MVFCNKGQFRSATFVTGCIEGSVRNAMGEQFETVQDHFKACDYLEAALLQYDTVYL